jgi:hypothetical protein
LIPVAQTIFKDVVTGARGNCLQACIASLLELPIREVPHFVQQENYPQDYYDWLRDRGLFWLKARIEVDGIAEYWGHHLILGDSPRGNCLHSVIGFNGEPVFDPHPSGAMLAGTRDQWEYGFLVRRFQ